MSEGKSFGFEKPKTKIYLLSFRMDKKHNDILQQLFTSLEVKPKKDTITDRMLMLIETMERIVKENQTLRDTAKSLKEANKKIENLEKQIEELKKHSVKVGILGDIVKEVEEGNILKETNIVKTVDSGQGEIIKPFHTRADLTTEIVHRAGPEQTILANRCPRGLSTKDVEQWLIACEVCESQARNTFNQCQTPMKKRYIDSKS